MRRKYWILIWVVWMMAQAFLVSSSGAKDSIREGRCYEKN